MHKSHSTSPEINGAERSSRGKACLALWPAQGTEAQGLWDTGFATGRCAVGEGSGGAESWAEQPCPVPCPVPCKLPCASRAQPHSVAGLRGPGGSSPSLVFGTCTLGMWRVSPPGSVHPRHSHPWVQFSALSPASESREEFLFKVSQVVLLSAGGQHRPAQLQPCQTREGDTFVSVCNLSGDRSTQPNYEKRQIRDTTSLGKGFAHKSGVFYKNCPPVRDKITAAQSRGGWSRRRGRRGQE